MGSISVNIKNRKHPPALVSLAKPAFRSSWFYYRRGVQILKLEPPLPFVWPALTRHCLQLLLVSGSESFQNQPTVVTTGVRQLAEGLLSANVCPNK